MSRDDIEQMVSRVAGEKPLPADVIQQLVDNTDGVPLYVEEMTKAVLESGVLKDVDGQYELAGSVASLAIPPTLQDSLMARLDRLVTAKAVAQYASVIGRQFSYELLHAVSDFDDVTLQRELGRLVDAELVYQRGIAPGATYTFKHALIQDTAYESLLRRTRQGYHRRIAEVLEVRFPAIVTEQPELLAYHLTEGVLPEQAIGYWQRAGERAGERSAYQEAISHVTTGLTLLQTLPETLDRHRQELPLQTALGAASRIVRGHGAPEVEAAYTRARLLCQQLSDTQDVFPVLYGLWRFYTAQADFPVARQLGEELLRLAERQDESSLSILAHYTIGSSCLWGGELQLAHTHLEESLAHFSRSQQRDPMFGTGQDLPRVACRVTAAVTLWLLGYPDQAVLRAHDALAVNATLARHFGETIALTFVSMVCQLRGEEQKVHDYAESAVTLATEQGFTFWLAYSTILQGWALAAGGEREEGLAQMRQGLMDYRASGAELSTTYFLSLIAEGYGNLKQVESGLDVLKEGLEVMERTGERLYEAELHRLKGQLLLQQSSDKTTEAESCFQQALSIARSQQAKSWELRAATSLARLWKQQGKREEARELLGNVYGWFTEGFATADLKDAKALLDELAH